jgi:ribose-phosphate pyrophosphokinase
MKNLRIFSGSSNPELAKGICNELGMSLGKVRISKFNNGEIRIRFEESVREKSVFLVQTCCSPVNDNLMELLIMVDALKRASAREITVVAPLQFYVRQDQKDESGTPISSKLIADLLTAAGVRRVITMDLHSGQGQGFYNIPVDNLYASPLLVPYLRENFQNNMVVVAPDAGGTKRARAYAGLLGCDLALIDKERHSPGQIKGMRVIGDVSGKSAVIIDDMVDTCGTLVKGAETLVREGAKKVIACVTHPVLSGNAVNKIMDSPIEQLIATNTVPLSEEAANCPKISQVSAAPLFASAIKKILKGEMLKDLFEIPY